ncbi:hypothetical protein [Litoreibacter meonggei]|nr:hypothetical protein [Litoreibacter meonggei]
MDSLGFLAYGFVLLSASTNDIRWLRVALFTSNLFFIAYGFALQLMPILLFNLLLGCINGYQAYRAWRRPLIVLTSKDQVGVGPALVPSTR